MDKIGGEALLAKGYLEITNICNCRCAFCPGTKRKAGFMSEETFLRYASQLRQVTKYLYLHVLGEPLLHPNLPRLLELAGQLDFTVILTTNGTLLSQRQRELLEAPSLHRVNISLHSFEAGESQLSFADYLSGCITYAKAAADAGKHTAFRLWNLDGPDTHGLRQENGRIEAALREAFPEPWRETRKGLVLSERVYLAYGERFEWPDPRARDFGAECFCYGLRDQVAVLLDGTVVPCCLDSQGVIKLGSLETQTLEEILESPKAKAIYDGFSRRTAVEPMCRRCGYARRFSSQRKK